MEIRAFTYGYQGLCYAQFEPRAPFFFAIVFQIVMRASIRRLFSPNTFPGVLLQSLADFRSEWILSSGEFFFFFYTDSPIPLGVKSLLSRIQKHYLFVYSPNAPQHSPF